jgi:hypothetical protein
MRRLPSSSLRPFPDLPRRRRKDGVAPIADLGYLQRNKPMPDLAGLPVSIKDLFNAAGEPTRRR